MSNQDNTHSSPFENHKSSSLSKISNHQNKSTQQKISYRQNKSSPQKKNINLNTSTKEDQYIQQNIFTKQFKPPKQNVTIQQNALVQENLFTLSSFMQDYIQEKLQDLVKNDNEQHNENQNIFSSVIKNDNQLDIRHHLDTEEKLHKNMDKFLQYLSSKSCIVYQADSQENNLFTQYFTYFQKRFKLLKKPQTITNLFELNFNQAPPNLKKDFKYLQLKRTRNEKNLQDYNQFIQRKLSQLISEFSESLKIDQTEKNNNQKNKEQEKKQQSTNSTQINVKIEEKDQNKPQVQQNQKQFGSKSNKNIKTNNLDFSTFQITSSHCSIKNYNQLKLLKYSLDFNSTLIKKVSYEFLNHQNIKQKEMVDISQSQIKQPMRFMLRNFQKLFIYKVQSIEKFLFLSEKAVFVQDATVIKPAKKNNKSKQCKDKESDEVKQQSQNNDKIIQKQQNKSSNNIDNLNNQFIQAMEIEFEYSKKDTTQNQNKFINNHSKQNKENLESNKEMIEEDTSKHITQNKNSTTNQTIQKNYQQDHHLSLKQQTERNDKQIQEIQQIQNKTIQNQVQPKPTNLNLNDKNIKYKQCSDKNIQLQESKPEEFQNRKNSQANHNKNQGMEIEYQQQIKQQENQSQKSDQPTQQNSVQSVQQKPEKQEQVQSLCLSVFFCLFYSKTTKFNDEMEIEGGQKQKSKINIIDDFKSVIVQIFKSRIPNQTESQQPQTKTKNKDTNEKEKQTISLDFIPKQNNQIRRIPVFLKNNEMYYKMTKQRLFDIFSTDKQKKGKNRQIQTSENDYVYEPINKTISPLSTYNYIGQKPKNLNSYKKDENQLSIKQMITQMNSNNKKQLTQYQQTPNTKQKYSKMVQKRIGDYFSSTATQQDSHSINLNDNLYSNSSKNYSHTIIPSSTSQLYSIKNTDPNKQKNFKQDKQNYNQDSLMPYTIRDYKIQQNNIQQDKQYFNQDTLQTYTLREYKISNQIDHLPKHDNSDKTNKINTQNNAILNIKDNKSYQNDQQLINNDKKEQQQMEDCTNPLELSFSKNNLTLNDFDIDFFSEVPLVEQQMKNKNFNQNETQNNVKNELVCNTMLNIFQNNQNQNSLINPQNHLISHNYNKTFRDNNGKINIQKQLFKENNLKQEDQLNLRVNQQDQNERQNQSMNIQNMTSYNTNTVNNKQLFSNKKSNNFLGTQTKSLNNSTLLNQNNNQNIRTQIMSNQFQVNHNTQNQNEMRMQNSFSLNNSNAKTNNIQDKIQQKMQNKKSYQYDESLNISHNLSNQQQSNDSDNEENPSQYLYELLSNFITNNKSNQEKDKNINNVDSIKNIFQKCQKK